MATTDREQSPDLIQELLQFPFEFDFHQAVRLIETITAVESESGGSAVAGDRGPQSEPIRFRALPSLSFPPGQISQVVSANGTTSHDSMQDYPLEMYVSFMGLFGPAGVLPQHYTNLVIERSHQRNKDDTLREFLDLFNHRLISFFHRAWEKYRFPFRYERRLFEQESGDDLFTRCLFSLTGLEVSGLRKRFTFDDQSVVYYGGLFAAATRNAEGLEQILSSYFGLTVSIRPFTGQWLDLPEELQSSFPSAEEPQGVNLQLGDSAVIGSRVWDVQSCFRIRIGPVGIEEFKALLPGGARAEAIQEIVQFYVGPGIDFDMQVILRKEEVPPLRLLSDGDARKSGYAPQLGWNTWLGSAGALHSDPEDVVFRFECI